MRAAAALATVLALLAVAPLIGPLVELIEGETEGWRSPEQMAAEARIEGDPASDDEVHAQGQAAGQPATVWLERTPAGTLEAVPASEALREANPMGDVDADMQLSAGPVRLDGPGELSPRFDIRVLVTVDRDDRFDEAWLRLDEQTWTRLEPAGVDGDRRVLRAKVAGGVLEAGESVHVDAVFDRHVGPDLVHRVHGPGWGINAVGQGPPAPELAVGEQAILVEGEADRWEAQHRSEEGAWSDISVHGDRVEPSEPGQVRVRGVDELGNPGPWSRPVTVEPAADPSGPDEAWRLLAPEPGSRVDGEVTIDWRPAEDLLVEVHAQPTDGGQRQLVDRASQPPITWRTGFVADGDWQLQIRALQQGNWTSRVVDVTVDNVEPADLAQAGGTDEEPEPAGVTPRTRSPWSAALATGAGLLAAGGVLARAWTRRPK